MPAPNGRFPLLFVAQVPIKKDTFDIEHINAIFSNHVTLPDFAPRGGDLMIAYPKADGTFDLRNLTREAGFGMKKSDPSTLETAACGENMVAVREPSMFEQITH